MDELVVGIGVFSVDVDDAAGLVATCTEVENFQELEKSLSKFRSQHSSNQSMQ